MRLKKRRWPVKKSVLVLMLGKLMGNCLTGAATLLPSTNGHAGIYRIYTASDKTHTMIYNIVLFVVDCKGCIRLFTCMAERNLHKQISSVAMPNWGRCLWALQEEWAGRSPSVHWKKSQVGGRLADEHLRGLAKHWARKLPRGNAACFVHPCCATGIEMSWRGGTIGWVTTESVSHQIAQSFVCWMDCCLIQGRSSTFSTLYLGCQSGMLCVERHIRLQ